MSSPDRIGRYRVLGALGRGGAGAVFRAVDERGEPVAIKVLAQGRGATDAQRRRFEREARALETVRHPHVVALRDHGEERGVPYLVLDLHEGGSLEDRLSQGRLLSPSEAARVGQELAAGLAQAHGRGVLHRDLKPANVLFDAEGRALLTDFGLAKDLGRVGQTAALSKTGFLQGTPGFWAPEQASGAVAQVSPRTDVFGLGATLYAALSGRAPFAGASLLEVASRTTKGEFPPLRSLRPEVSPELAAVVERCLALDPRERWPDAVEVADALAGLGAGVQQRGARRGAALVGAGVALALLVGAGAASLGGSAREPSATPAATRAGAATASPAPSGPASGPEPSATAGPAREDEGARLFERARRASAAGEAEEARELLERAVALDHPPALVELARELVTSKRVEVRSRVLRLLRRGAELDYPPAMTALSQALKQSPGDDPPETLPLLRRAAAAGEARALYLLGNRHEYGRGVPKDMGEAIRYYRESASRGDVRALTDMGVLTLEGRAGLPKDPAAAVRLFREAAEQDDVIAISNLASLLDQGIGAQQDYEEAARWLRRGTELGDADCTYGLGMATLDGKGISVDVDEAIRLLKLAGERGSAKAPYALGKIHQHPTLGRTDLAAAAHYYGIGVKINDPKCMNTLANLKLRGVGVPRDPAGAAALLQRGVELDHAPCMHGLGSLYEGGLGVPRDPARAVALYRRAAAKGLASSMVNLALCYENGLGVAKDDREAARLYRRAAEQENPQALVNLALLHLRGAGVLKDPLLAKALAERAAKVGSPNAMLLLGQMAEKKSEPDLAAARVWYSRAREAALRSGDARVGKLAGDALGRLGG